MMVYRFMLNLRVNNSRNKREVQIKEYFFNLKLLECHCRTLKVWF